MAEQSTATNEPVANTDIPNATAAGEESKPKVMVVDIQFRTAGNLYTFKACEENLNIGDYVILEAEEGHSFGIVASTPYELSDKGTPPTQMQRGQAPTKKVIRKATDKDIEEEFQKREKAYEYHELCKEKIKEKGLPMKLIETTIEEGGKKAVFIFYAEQRVDFRALVKELASTLRVRIEMRQIGSRDEAKIVGSLGTCGIATCCSCHLRGFQSISISMAKHQGLAPNPAKLTGMCNKLKCCLAYEHEVYNEYRKDLPKVGSVVESPHGSGKIIGHNILKRECHVKLFGGGDCHTACAECKLLSAEEGRLAQEAAKKIEDSGEERARRIQQKRTNGKKPSSR